MDTITLPMVDTDVSLKDALKTMKDAGRSGIVWQKNSREFVLYTAARVVVGTSKKHGQSLLDLQGENVNTPDIGTIADKTAHSFIGLEILAATLHAATVTYGLLAAGVAGDVKKAILFTNDPNVRTKLESAPADCFCPQCDRAGQRGSTCPIHKVLLVCGS
jgi:hypothetical protein